MNAVLAAEAPAHRTIQLPALGTYLPHLCGTFWAVMRARPGSGEADYALLVPHGPEFERQCAWGGSGKDESGAACLWDGLANTRALVASKHEHPAAEFCAGLNATGLPELYLPSLRELKALFAAGCDAFDEDGWYWSSTQFSRSNAYGQDFYDGDTDNYVKSWEGGRARAVRRFLIG